MPTKSPATLLSVCKSTDQAARLFACLEAVCPGGFTHKGRRVFYVPANIPQASWLAIRAALDAFWAAEV